MSKGRFISNMLDEPNIKKAILIDDAVEYLDSVKEARVKFFFADWDYGVNSFYDVYRY